MRRPYANAPSQKHSIYIQRTSIKAENGSGLLAACEQEPELARQADAYRRRRLAEAAAGQLEVIVGHVDLLVLPGSAR